MNERKTGRNDDCPCGSGKKYKKCCLAGDEASIRDAALTKQRADAEEQAQLHSAPTWDIDEVDEIDDEELPEAEEMTEQDRVWERFYMIEDRGAAQLDALLTELLALPPDEDSHWTDVFLGFVREKHPDVTGVFRRISSEVPHNVKCGLGFFYWVAAETFIRRGEQDLLPEVVEGFCRLNVDTYAADALRHIESNLLAEGLVDETLRLSEHFLPIMCEDTGLTPWAVQEICGSIYEMRAGRALENRSLDQMGIEQLTADLRQDVGDYIHEDLARVAAEIATSHAPPIEWTRSEFDLVKGDINEDEEAWRDNMRLSGVILHVAEEGGRIDEQPPGKTVPGLFWLLRNAHDWKAKRGKKASANLLDHLRPSELEERILDSCSEFFFGLDAPRARLLVDAHEILTRFAARHELTPADDAEEIEKELARLRHEITRTHSPASK